MKKKDIIIIGIMLIVALWIIVLPKNKSEFYEISPSELINEINKNERYISTDDVAKYIIEKNPTVLLVDIRTKDEYKEYTLPGALNIPYDSILSPNFENYVNQNIYTVIFFSNGSSLSDQAWLNCKRIGFNNIYVMKGGLNHWFQTIIRPIEPEEFATPEEFDLYSFRQGASMFFGGGSSDGSSGDATTLTVEFQQRDTEVGAGGCE